MKRIQISLFILILILVFAGSIHRTCYAQSPSIYFDDSNPDVIVVGNQNYYELGLSKQHGAIAYIIDKTTGQRVMPGSQEGTGPAGHLLWMVEFTNVPDPADQFQFSAVYSPAGPNQFDYVWEDATNTLILQYTPDPMMSRQVEAMVTFEITEGPYFDMQLTIDNRWGYPLIMVNFPVELTFAANEIEEVLLPYLHPGIVLQSGFFTEGRSYRARYPGDLHADYLVLQMQGGSLALYGLHPSGPVRPAMLQISPHPEFTDTTVLTRELPAWKADGELWRGSPVRVRVSGSFVEIIQAYRADNAVAAYPSVQQKLGDKFEAVARSPMGWIGAGMTVPQTFGSWPQLFAQLPGSTLIAPFWDPIDPDFLPPDPQWGTTEDLRQAIEAAQEMGHLVMPISQAVWWNERSPTVQGFSSLSPPLTITDVAVLDESGQPQRYCWGPDACGFNVSPHPAYVKQRLDQYIQDMTQVLPSDLIYHDVIGAFPWEYDFNPSAPSPMDFSEGWLEHVRTYSDVHIVVESGYDRILEYAIGGMGTFIYFEGDELGKEWWGEGNWRSYAAEPLLMHDKSLHYRIWEWHPSKYDLSVNLAFGYMDRFNICAPPMCPPEHRLPSPWVNVVTDFQAHVSSRYVGARMTGYDELPDNVTLSTFETDDETISVLKNWDTTNTYTVDEYTLSSDGVFVTSSLDNLIAGIFTAYNGVPLSEGDHFIIEQRNAEDIVVRHPMGPDTDITLDMLPNWSSSDPISVMAYDRDNRLIKTITPTISDSSITFPCNQRVNDTDVAFYQVTRIEITPTATQVVVQPTEEPTVEPTDEEKITEEVEPRRPFCPSIGFLLMVSMAVLVNKHLKRN
ncbi:MAG: hypothetical protein ACE5NP_00250 [Anaerolineae bacterium]